MNFSPTNYGKKKGFHPTWIGWIMECISSVTYSILVNRELKGHITPTNLSLKWAKNLKERRILERNKVLD